MAWISKGYEETVNYAEHSILMDHAGGMSVFGPNSFKVTVGVGDRVVRAAAGEAAAAGIYDVSTAAENFAAGSPVVSGSRWDMAVLRRNWAPEVQATGLVLIPGGTAMALPARETTVGELHDQPLALVRFSAGQTAAQEIIDLRCWHGPGGVVAAHALALGYLDRIGSVVRVGDVEYSRALNSSGTAGVWRAIGVGDTGWVDVVRSGHWSWTYGQVRRIGSVVYYRIVANRSAGWATGFVLATVPPGFRPSADWFALSSHAQGENAEFMFGLNGNLTAGKPSNGDTAVNLNGSYPVADPVMPVEDLVLDGGTP